MNSLPFVKQAMDTAHQAAVQGGQTALKYFRSGITAEWKEDNSPVTEADRQAEVAILNVIKAQFPNHSILGEESGLSPGDQDYRWLVDPIDGTRGFVRGGRFWGSLVALQYRGKVIAGAMALPALDLVYSAGQGLGCFRNGTRVQVRSTQRWEEAIVSVGELQHLLKPPYHIGMTELMRSAASTRCYGDPAGLMMVLDGLADVWIEGGVKPWDLGPSQILIEEAGGTFTNFHGTMELEDGTAIASNGYLHERVLSCLRSMRVE